MSEAKQWVLDDAAAAFYEANFVPALFADWADRLVTIAAPSPVERVLDVACGTGVVARRAAQAKGTADGVTGVDLSPSMLKVAKRAQPDIEWRTGDAQRLPVDEESFDVVLSQAALMFMPDRAAALREMRRALKPGGRIAVQVFGESAGYMLTADILEEVAGKEAADIFRAPFSLRNPDELLQIVREGGFVQPNVDTQEGAAIFPSLGAFLQTEIHGWVLAGKVDVDALLEASQDRLGDFTQEDGSIRIPVGGHIVTARK